MKRLLRRGVRVLLVLLVGYFVAGYVTARWSPDPERLPDASVERVERPAVDDERPYLAHGALSVHTGRSHDAVGTFVEVAEAAERTGLDFVVLGDHGGDWAVNTDSMAPRWRGDVLLVPGLEMVVANRGRVLVFGLDTLPTVWEGSLEDLVARVHPEDGFVSVVHPRSPKERESWKDSAPAGAHAWESFDVSEMARSRLEEPWVGYHVAGLLLGIPTGRLDEAVVGFWRERSETPAILAYDSVRADGPMTLTGGLNHHPKTRFGGRPVPGYAPFFRTVVNHIRLPEPLSFDPAVARRQLATALRTGNVFVSLGHGDRVHGFRFWVESADGSTLRPGENGPLSDDASILVRVPDRAPGDVFIRLVRNGREAGWVAAQPAETIVLDVPGPGIWRVEVHHAGFRVPGGRLGLRPWILSNPIALETAR
jgi:hypothetical protein